MTCGDKSHCYRDALEQKEFPSCFIESRGVPCCGSWHCCGETLVLAHESCSCPTWCSWVIPRGSWKDARSLTCCSLQLQEHQLCFQFPSTAIDTNIHILYLLAQIHQRLCKKLTCSQSPCHCSRSGVGYVEHPCRVCKPTHFIPGSCIPSQQFGMSLWRTSPSKSLRSRCTPVGMKRITLRMKAVVGECWG